MGGKALCEQRVHRLQFVFPAVLIAGVVALTTASAFESRDEQELKEFAAVVLKDVADAVLRRERLVFADEGKQAVEFRLVRVRPHRLLSRSTSGNTSPPVALQRKKEYGNKAQSEYVAWLGNFARLVHRKLKDDGSFVLDLGGAYEPGSPTRSLYNFRIPIHFCDQLGFHLAEDFYWH